MNLDQLKPNVGSKVKLVPPACHLDVGGDSLPPPPYRSDLRRSGRAIQLKRGTDAMITAGLG
jgi:hypothetical protein